MRIMSLLLIMCLAVWTLFVLAGTTSSRAETNTGGTIITGTAFLVSHDGYMLTNNHVIEGCKSIVVYVPANKFPYSASATDSKRAVRWFFGSEGVNGVPQAVRVVQTDPQTDLALLILESVEKNRAEKISAGIKPWDAEYYKNTPFFSPVPPFRDSSNSVALGEGVTVVGFPLRGLLTEINVTTGIVSSLSGPMGNKQLIQITAPVQRGNSGGPLLDDRGNVIGVIVSKLDAVKTFEISGDVPQNVNFAIRGEIARDFLQSYLRSIVEASSSTEKKDAASIAREAVTFTFPVECQK